MHRKSGISLTALRSLSCLLLTFCTLISFVPVFATENANSNYVTVRNEDFESWNTGAICAGTVYYPTEVENEEQAALKGMGVKAKNSEAYIRQAANEAGQGGVSATVSKDAEANLVTVTGKDGKPTQAFQIYKPAEVELKTNTYFTLYPTSVSLNTTELIYSVDIKNGGKCGKEGDPGYVLGVNNRFKSLSFGPVTLDFESKQLIFSTSGVAVPAVETAESLGFYLPDSGEWFNVSIRIDTINNMIYVSINGKELGSRYYGGLFYSLSTNNTRWYVTASGTEESVVYFDNLSVKMIDIPSDELTRLQNARAFKKLGNSLVMCAGSNKYYYGEEVGYIDVNDITVMPKYASDGKVAVPVRFVAEKYGYSVAFKDGVTTLERPDRSIKLTSGVKSADINGEATALSLEPYIEGGRQMLSVSDMAMLTEQFLYEEATGLITLCPSQENLLSPSIAADALSLSTILNLFPEAAMGFEVENKWFSDEDPVQRFGEEHKSRMTILKETWKGITSLEKLRYGGVSLSNKYVKSGRYSGRWADHHFWPTIMTESVPADWTAYNTLSFWIYSEEPTGETITVAALSNIEKEMEYGDYSANSLYSQIEIDFTGWKKFELPLETFQKIGNPQGFGKVEGLYFYTKALHHDPNPYTVIYLDDIKLEKKSDDEAKAIADAELEKLAAKEAEKNAPKDYIVDAPEEYADIPLHDYLPFLEYKKQISLGNDTNGSYAAKAKAILTKWGINEDKYQYSDLVVNKKVRGYQDEILPFEYVDFNHNYPEIQHQLKEGELVKEQPYHRLERAVYGYYPRYFAGHVYTHNGYSYVEYDYTTVQVVHEDGTWYKHDIMAQLDEYISELYGDIPYWARAYSGRRMRFDADGDAYRIIQIQSVETPAPFERLTLLAHSRDNLKTWDFYKLSKGFCEFESIGVHNKEDAEARPPVIIGNDDWLNNSVDLSGVIIVPEKNADGTLTVPEGVKFTDRGISPLMTGAPSPCVTVGNKVFIANSTLMTQEEAATVIPDGHPILDFPSYRDDGGNLLYLKNGVPAFCTVYDLETKTLSEPVYVASGGKSSNDAHNWSCIQVDGEGYLHMFAIGHHAPFIHAKSKKPADASEWDIQMVSDWYSYNTLDIMPDNSIVTTGRNSQRGYQFDLTMTKMTPDGTWQKDREVVSLWRSYYHQWKHQTDVDPDTGRIYLSYIPETNQMHLFGDAWYSWAFIEPDQCIISVNEITGMPSMTQYANTGSKQPGERVILVSDDYGENWRFAITEDFIKKEE